MSCTNTYLQVDVAGVSASLAPGIPSCVDGYLEILRQFQIQRDQSLALVDGDVRNADGGHDVSLNRLVEYLELLDVQSAMQPPIMLELQVRVPLHSTHLANLCFIQTIMARNRFLAEVLPLSQGSAIPMVELEIAYGQYRKLQESLNLIRQVSARLLPSTCASLMALLQPLMLVPDKTLPAPIALKR